jgi:PIN domain nuclease of toxin-antitoxin system
LRDEASAQTDKTRNDQRQGRVAHHASAYHACSVLPIARWLTVRGTLRPGLHLLDLNRPVLVESCRLPQPFHGDPADQLIVATARAHDAVIVTKDDLIRRYAHVRSLW